MATIRVKSANILRRGTAENWQNKNPILRKGEQGLETDTGIMKIGDGETEYNSLSDDNIYFPKSRINKSADDVKSYANSTFANAIKGTKSGTVILLDEISPVTHEMGVKVRGKNLIPYPYVTSSGSKINGITWTVNEDGSVTANGTATGNSNFVVISQDNPIAIAGKTVTLSGCPTGGSRTTYGIYYYDTVTSRFDYGNGVTFIPKGVVSVNIRIFGGATVDNLVFKPQLELGTTATEYTPYIDLTAVKVIKSNASGEAVAEYTPTADGTVNGVTSLYPNTTLTTDTDGVIIDCEYNKDINKFADLTEYVKHTDIDQTYSSTSENAQSGKAVAGAIKRGTTTTPEQEIAQFGEELVSATGWTSDGWTGDLSNGFTHTSGNANSLIFTMPEATGTKSYQVSFNSSVDMTTTNLMVRIGGSELFNLYGQENPINVGIKSVSDGALEFVPESTFTGTISNISIKEITGSYSGNYTITDSNGEESFSIRTSKASNTGQGFGFENLFMGSESGETNTSGHGNVGVGSKTLHYNTSGFWNLAVGYNALFRNTVGSRNIALGYGSLQSNISGQRNIGIGTFSLINNTTGCFNISIGADCLNDNVSGNYNVGLGYGCLYYNNSGVENVAIGRQALSNTSIGQNNIGLGSFAGVKSEGKHNIFLGKNSGYNNQTGNYNVLLGYNAGKGVSGANYSQTIILGSLSGQNLASASMSNIIIGQYSGNGITSGTGNIIIGGSLCNSDNLFNSLNIGGLILGSLYGDIYMELAGGLKLSNIPTSDPNKAGRVWNDNGTLKVSAGQ